MGSAALFRQFYLSLERCPRRSQQNKCKLSKFLQNHRYVQAATLRVFKLIFLIFISLLSLVCAYALVTFIIKNHLIRVKKTSWFGVKIPVLVSMTTDGDGPTS